MVSPRRAGRILPGGGRPSGCRGVGKAPKDRPAVCEHTPPLLLAWASVSETLGTCTEPWGLLGAHASAPSHVFCGSETNLEEMPRQSLAEVGRTMGPTHFTGEETEAPRALSPPPSGGAGGTSWGGGWHLRTQLFPFGNGSPLVTWVWSETRTV